LRTEFWICQVTNVCDRITSFSLELKDNKKKLNDEEMIERLKIYLVECRYTCVCELISFKTSAPREYIWEMRERTRERREKREKWKITTMRFDVKLMLDDRGYDFFFMMISHSEIFWIQQSILRDVNFRLSFFLPLSLSLSFFSFVIVS